MAVENGIRFTPELDKGGIASFKASVDDLLKNIKESKKLQIKNVELMASAQRTFTTSVNRMLKEVGNQVGIEIKNVQISDQGIASVQKAVANATSSLTKIDLTNVNKQIAQMDAELAKISQRIVPSGFIDAAAIQEAQTQYQKLLALMEQVKTATGSDKASGAAALSTQINLLNELISLRGAEAAQEQKRLAMAEAADTAATKAISAELDLARKQLESLSVSSKNVGFTDTAQLAEYARKWDEIAQAIINARTMTGQAATEAVASIHAEITELQALVTANNLAADAAKERARQEQEAADAQSSILKSYETRVSKLGVNTNVAQLFQGDELNDYISRLNTINTLIEVGKTETGEARQAAIDMARSELSALEELVGQRKADIAASKAQEAVAKEASKSRTAEYTELSKLVNSLDTNKALKTDNASAIEAYKQEYQQLISLVEHLKTAETGDFDGIAAQIRERAAALKELAAGYNEDAQAAKQAAAAEREAATLSQQYAAFRNQLQSFTIANPKVYNLNKAEINSWFNAIDSGANRSSTSLNAMKLRFTEIKGEMVQAGTQGKTFFQTLKAGWEKFGGWSLVTRSFTKVISTFKQMVTAVKEVDSAMTELRKVTDLTASQYERFYDTATKMAVNVGAKLSDTINATADFSRLGYSITEATQLAEASLVYFNVGDGIESISAATESLISTMKAFGIEAANSMSIIDMFNEVGNNFAISSTGIGEALQRSASALATAGNTIEESIGLVVAANDVVQNPESVGELMRPAA